MSYKVICEKCGKEIEYSIVTISGEDKHLILFDHCKCSKKKELKRPPLGSWWRLKGNPISEIQFVSRSKGATKTSTGVYWEDYNYENLKSAYERFYPCPMCGEDMVFKIMPIGNNDGGDDYLWCDNCYYESNTFVRDKIMELE